MERNMLRIIVTYLLLLSSCTVALPFGRRKRDKTDTNNAAAAGLVLSSVNGQETQKKGLVTSPLSINGEMAMKLNEAAVTTSAAAVTAASATSKTIINAIFPPTNSKIDVGADRDMTLSFNIQASDVRKVRLILDLSGIATYRFVIRGGRNFYSLGFINVPNGLYTWYVEVITMNDSWVIRKETFGPWRFEVEDEESTPPGTTPGSPGTGTTQSPASSPTPGGGGGGGGDGSGTATPQNSPTTPTRPPTTTTTDSSITAGLQSDCLQVDPTKFNICLDLKSNSGSYEPWMEDFGIAKQRWEAILQDDGEKAFDLDMYWRKNRDLIATALPPLVDDIYISGFMEQIDGVGGVLGMATPYFMKNAANGYKRPVAGYMKFDIADEAWLRRDGIWTNTIIHEMGHVLGLGTMWQQNGLTSGSLTDDQYRQSSNAQAAWEKICPGGRLPIETTNAAEGIGEGTAGGHWDEECVLSEMMTGFVDKQMPLSNLTIASLADMGYKVDYSKAEPFGQENLGNCGKYCPTLQQRHNLRGLSESEKPVKRKVSANGHRLILHAAARELGKIRSDTVPPSTTTTTTTSSSSSTTMPEEIEYYPGNEMTVYIIDEDGDIKEETVSWVEAKQYAIREGINI